MADPFGDVDVTARRAARVSKWSKYRADVVPAWVAEMDVDVCPAVRAAVDASLDLGSVGYRHPSYDEELADVFADRYARRAGWRPDPEYARPVTGVIATFGVLLARFTEPGDEVVLQTPVFPPFRAMVEGLGRRVVEHRAELVGAAWTFDAERLDALVTERTRLLVVVNPHNPLGTVLSRDDLTALADVAVRRGLLVVADEVHADLVLDGGPHVPIGSLDHEVAARTVTVTSAAKSHNIAGMRCAVAHFGSADLLAAFEGLDRVNFWEVSTPGLAATIGAWRDGDGWLADVLDGIAARRDELASFVGEHLPDVGWVPGAATYLAWLDCGALGLREDPASFFLERALVALAAGVDYGSGYESFVRLTFATSAAVLSEILERMVTAVDLRAW